MKRFEIWTLIKEDVEDVSDVAFFLTFIVKEAYDLLKSLTYPGKPISFPYATPKELPLDHV